MLRAFVRFRYLTGDPKIRTENPCHHPYLVVISLSAWEQSQPPRQFRSGRLRARSNHLFIRRSIFLISITRLPRRREGFTSATRQSLGKGTTRRRSRKSLNLDFPAFNCAATF